MKQSSSVSRPITSTLASIHAGPARSAMLLAILAAFAGPALAQAPGTTAPVTADAGPSAPGAAPNGTVALSGTDYTYVGAQSHVGIGYDKDTKLRGEGSHVLSEDALSAIIAQGWVSRKTGGVRADYNWIPGNDGKPAIDTWVRKLFGAVDRNQDGDQKATIGFGLESENWFGQLSYSHSITGRRFIGDTTTTDTTQVTGDDATGRPYIDTITTTTLTRMFEHAYQQGVGVRAGHYYEPALVRLSLGLDHEWGEFSSKQTTVALDLEKFFSHSPHSLALHVEHYNKSGEYETRGNDTRAQIMYRYAFGGSAWADSAGWRQSRSVQQLPVQTAAVTEPQVAAVAAPAAPPIVQTKTETRIVKATASMTSDAFFQLDKSALTDVAKAELDRIANMLKSSEHAGAIRIVGHTCDLGSDAYNLKLSVRRANAVRDYLVSQGVGKADSFVTEGKGKREPKYPNTKATRSKNRRVDLEFIVYQNKTEQVEIPVQTTPAAVVPGAPTTRNVPIVEWKTEVVETEPAWVRRALHNTVRHKQTVDNYRGAEITKTAVTNRVYVNRPPTARDDAVTILGSVATTINVLANDTDPDGNPLTIVSVGAAAHGSAVIAGNAIVYTPVAGYVGTDTFTYTIDDGQGGKASAKVVATIQPALNPPVAADDAVTIHNWVPTTINVLANDTDPNGYALSVASVGTPAHGTATVSGNAVLYTPTQGYLGVDTFTYVVSDGHGGTATAHVSATMLSANRPPVAVDDRYVVTSSMPMELKVLSNDSDPDGGSLTIVSFTQPADGVVTLEGSHLLFSPAGRRFAIDTFTYTISDGHGTATATVTLIDP